MQINAKGIKGRKVTNYYTHAYSTVEVLLCEIDIKIKRELKIKINF